MALDIQMMPVLAKSLVQGYFPPADSKYGDAARHATARYYVPDSQREWANSWNAIRQQNFIDSIMMNFPVPSIICNQDPDGRMALYEGRHRTECLWRFVHGHIRWNDKTYEEMSDIERFRFDNKPLNIIVINGATLDQLSEIFERLNSGAPLSDSDKFWNRRHTRLVKFTREITLQHEGLRRVWGNVDMTKRGHLANYVALTAGILLGANYFTTSYMRLFPHLDLAEKTDEECKSDLEVQLGWLVRLYERANTEFPVIRQAKLSKYRKIGFINAYFLQDMMRSILDVMTPETMLYMRDAEEDCMKKWIAFLGRIRNEDTEKQAYAALATKGAQNLTQAKIETVIAQVNAFMNGTFEGEETPSDSEED